MENNLDEFIGKYIYTKSNNPADDHYINVCSSESKNITVKGYHLPTNNKMTYKYFGKWVRHLQYGMQFEVEYFEENIQDSKESIVEYLSCGVVKGIGPKTAEKIFDKFGRETLKILEKNPEQLLQISGITKNKLEIIKESMQKNSVVKDIVKYLIPYDITTRTAFKIYECFKENSLNVIKENPYALCNIKGITFLTADCIGKQENIPADNINRFEACVKYVLKKNETKGHTCMELGAYGYRVQKLLGYKALLEDEINRRTLQMIQDKKITVKKIKKMNRETNVIELKCYIMNIEAYNTECKIANKIVNIRNETIRTISNIDVLIKNAEKEFGITLDSEQLRAVKEALNENIAVITGGPGTGKTTILKIISYVYGHAYEKNERIFLAPTGIAESKMAESTGHQAYTVHSYLHIREGEISDEEIEITNSLLAVDEFSMMDIWITSKLMDSIKSENKVIFLGDVDQLPSVGAGAVLRDIIESDVVKVIRLEKLYRQDENSKIYTNCRNIKKGIEKIEEGNDFQIHEIRGLQYVQNAMVETYIRGVQEVGKQNVLCLCPFKKGFAGVYEMNKIIQERTNPKKYGFPEMTKNGMILREGDVVMQLKNEDMVSNGDLGIVQHIIKGTDGKEMYIKFFNSKVRCYSEDMLEDVTLAYAITVHKSQGCESKRILTCLTKEHAGNSKNEQESFLDRNLPYTAFSRAKNKVDFFGEYEALMAAIRNKKTKNRNTFLLYRLKFESGQAIAA